MRHTTTVSEKWWTCPKLSLGEGRTDSRLTVSTIQSFVPSNSHCATSHNRSINIEIVQDFFVLDLKCSFSWYEVEVVAEDNFGSFSYFIIGIEIRAQYLQIHSSHIKMEYGTILLIVVGVCIGLVAATLAIVWVAKKRRDFSPRSTAGTTSEAFRKLAPNLRLTPSDIHRSPIYKGPAVKCAAPQSIYKLPKCNDCVVLLPGLQLADATKV
ncbi:hypothetical protein Btru_066988 [Bulinus truncatus]|nr:hypothetical protein Btru_066988 [Bulinus truncatus]